MVLLRLPYLALTSRFAFIRLLPMSNVDKNVLCGVLTRRRANSASNSTTS
jgi:hypothetical protein